MSAASHADVSFVLIYAVLSCCVLSYQKNINLFNRNTHSFTTISAGRHIEIPPPGLCINHG